LPAFATLPAAAMILPPMLSSSRFSPPMFADALLYFIFDISAMILRRRHARR
jgi:hypothetical protein